MNLPFCAGFQGFRTLAVCSVLLMAPALGWAQSPVLFDSFNRASNTVLGLPSVGGPLSWSETETAGSNDYRVRISANSLYLTNTNNLGAGSEGIEQVSIDMTGRYATQFAAASTEMNWLFNMHNSKAEPTGFGFGNFGAAVVLGSDMADFASPTADGYAVVIGGAGAVDAVRLVHFTGGLTNNNRLTDIAVSTQTTATSYNSVKVTYNSCTGQWSLLVRSDGETAFAEPATIAGTPVTGINQSHVALDLKFAGALWQHGASPIDEALRVDNFYIPTSVAASVAAYTYTWTGAVSTDFQVAANWSPARDAACLKAIDILKFTNAGTATVTNVPTQTIGQLMVVASDITFQASAASILIIAGNLTAAEDLLVSSDSKLNITGSNPLSIRLKTEADAEIFGSMAFSGANHTLISINSSGVQFANSDAVHFNSGSSFTQGPGVNTNVFGNTALSTLRVVFKSGSVFNYAAPAGLNPFALTQPNSVVSFEPGSLYRQLVPQTMSFAGRTYGNIEMDFAGTMSNSGGNASSLINGSIIFTNGTVNITAALQMSVIGNITVNGGAFNYTPASAANLNLNGTMPQTISGAGIFTLGVNSTLVINNTNDVNLARSLAVDGNLNLINGTLRIMAGNTLAINKLLSVSNGFLGGTETSNLVINGSGNLVGNLTFAAAEASLGSFTLNRSGDGEATLGSLLSIYNNMQFTDGRLFNSSGTELTFKANATATGASASSYVSGPVIKEGIADFMFPIGDEFYFGPSGITRAGITSPVAIAVRAQYYNDNPMTALTPGIEDTYSDPVKHVSKREFWWINQVSGSGAGAGFGIVLSWEDSRSGGVTDLSKLLVARLEDASFPNTAVNWVSEGNSATTGTALAGTITSTIPGSASQTYFTLGSNDPDNSINPLPVSLIYFKGQLKNEQVDLSWATASEQNSAYFEIERSTDGRTFTAVGQVAAAGTTDQRQVYAFTDFAPLAGQSYYRLRQTDRDGLFATYGPVSIKLGATALSINALYPNPATHAATVLLESPAAETVQLRTINSLGMVVRVQQFTLAAGANQLGLDLKQLPSGVYLLEVAGNELRQTIRFEKQ